MSYKRLDHFNGIVDLLAATHARSATIPDDSIVGMKARLVELAINPDTLTFNIMSDILRSMRLEKYLEDVPYLMQKLGDYKPPVFSQELRERLQNMFQAISLPPFRNMNYNYILVKLLQILDETNLMQYVPHQKRAAHDEMWCDICATNNWPFYCTA